MLTISRQIETLLAGYSMDWMATATRAIEWQQDSKGAFVCPCYPFTNDLSNVEYVNNDDERPRESVMQTDSHRKWRNATATCI